MFTPPPSPLSFRTGGFNISTPVPSTTELHNPEEIPDSRNSDDAKRRTGRRFLWAVILLPLIVITSTVCAGFSTSLVQKISLPLSRHEFVSDHSKWKREPEPQATEASVSSSTDSASTTLSPTPTTASPTTTIPVASQTLPTIPSSPPTLPTPFPQAFDEILTQNFSSSSCLNFFNNMTNSMDFRPCRPFSFLFSTSSTFNNAQTNLTLMNTLIWGTCNTPVPYSQCQSNMASFASQLQTACSQELTNRNLMAVNSLIALRAFSVMHDSACLADPTTNTYCILSAARNPNPSDLYFYSLPMGIKLPSTSKPSCSACSKSLMGIYAAALQDPSQATLLTGLKTAYQASAQFAVGLCGAAFAQTSISAAVSLYRGSPTVFTGSILALTWIMFTQLS